MNKANKKRILVFIIVFLLVMTIANFIDRQDKIPEQPETAKNEKVDFDFSKKTKILLLGADSIIPGKLSGWHGRSDFIAVLYINPKTDEVSFLSIPRDTKIELKKHKTSKINAANQVGGYKLARKAVQKLLDIKIDHVVVLSIQTVIDLLDEAGPLKIFVPEEMQYDDNSAGLHINIKPGLQEMNGKGAMDFIRFRNANRGDIARIERQQIFLRAAVKKLQEPNLIFKLPNMLYKANQAFLTDMSFKSMFELGILLRSLSPGNYKSYIVPGDFGSNGYWLANQEELESIVKRIKYGEPSKEQ